MNAKLNAALIAAALAVTAAAQQPAPGLRLYQVLGTGETGLVDLAGNLVHAWAGTLPGLSAHLMPDGSLLRTARSRTFPAQGVTGAIQRVAFDGALLWDYRFDGPDAVAHHEVEVMPNGNLLMIAWDVKTAADAIAAGRDPALLAGNDFFPDAIYEVRQTGPTTAEVVWEWHLWDHMVQQHDSTLPNYGEVSQHPELLDINYPPQVLSNGDWNHFNGIDYDPIDDWIVVSARSQNEIYIIDHSTTTAEAAGHVGGRRGKGGDLLYRWGNPQAYQRGGAADQQLFGQHDPRFVPPGYPGAGHVTVFNNGWSPTQSAVHELVLPRDPNGDIRRIGRARHGPARPIWSYTSPEFHSPFMSSAERLPNGNTLICSAMQSTMFEVTPSGQEVWGRLVEHAGISVFQCHYVERSLWSDADEFSIAAGGRIEFDHLLGSAMGSEFYLLLGSSLGTSTGWFEGDVLVPLDFDSLYMAMASEPNAGPFIDTMGQLAPHGHARSALQVGPGVIPIDLLGVRLHFAHAIFDSTTLRALRSGNPVPVTLTR